MSEATQELRTDWIDPPGQLVDATVLLEAGEADPQGTTLRRRAGGLLNTSTATWIGLALAAAGFAAIFYSWTKVAGLVNVAQQMPYLVSGGITGLAFVIVGATVVDVAARRQDSHERRQQLTQITRALAALHQVLDADSYDREGPDE